MNPTCPTPPLALRVTCSLLALSVLPAAQDPVAPKPPNLIFVMVDDLGWGDLSCYGQEVLETPNIDRIAREGRRYTQFYAGSTVCAPSRAVLLTGLHTGHCAIRGNSKQNLLDEDVTIAEVLAGARYTSGLAGKWGIGHEGSDGMPTRQGFEHFFGYLDQHHAHNYYPTFLVRGEERVPLDNTVPNVGKYGQGVASKKVQYSHDLITDDALAFLERKREEPFFLYVAWTLPHANNEAGREGMEVPDLGPFADKDWPDPEKGFAAMIARLDRDVGRLLAKLEELSLDENTVLFFTSDNGPHSEGGHRADFFDSNGPLRGTKRDLTEGGIRVPLIVRWPGRVPAGTTSDHVAGFQDVLPTLAELAGATDHVPEGLDGISFVPSLLGREDEQREHEALYWAFYERNGARALRRGTWKAVQQPIDTAVRLYDLSTDIGEEQDLASEYPRLVAELVEHMDAEYQASEYWKLPTAGPK